MSAEIDTYSDFFIVGVCRDVEKILELEIKRLFEAIGPKKNVKFFIVESDSADRTSDVLKHLKNKYRNFEFESLGNLTNHFKLRTERIAYCRNRYMQYLDSNASSDSIVVIADLDGANSDLTNERFNSIWIRSDWDAVCANQKFAYFDIWALRHPVWSPTDWITEYEQLISENMRKSIALKKALYSKMIRIDEESDWIEVESAFGGLGVYKFKAIRGARYSGKLKEREICEHISFSQFIRSSGGRIFIVPSLINSNSSSHTLILRKTIRVKTRVKKILRISNKK